jgi:hypothetical protein
MKILDVDCKGNLVRFHLGESDLKNWYGDDWNDTPFEHNAGPVYDQFVEKYLCVCFQWDYAIFTPDYGHLNSHYCRNVFKTGRIPILVAIKDEEGSSNYVSTFEQAIVHPNAELFYMGQEMT